MSSPGSPIQKDPNNPSPFPPPPEQKTAEAPVEEPNKDEEE